MKQFIIIILILLLTAFSHSANVESNRDPRFGKPTRGDLIFGTSVDRWGIISVGDALGAPATTYFGGDGVDVGYRTIEQIADDIEGSISHLNLLDIGSNTHTQVDAHLADNSQAHSDYLKNNEDDTTTGVLTVEGLGTGGQTDYDLKVGDTDGTPTYGMIQMGNSCIGRTAFKAGNIDLDGTMIYRNIAGPVTSEIEHVFVESTGDSTRFALAKAGVGNATYNSRSMLIAGPAPADTDYVKVTYWQTNNNIFDNLVCDTSGVGADLGVQNDLEVEGDLFTDSIKESTTDAGVTFNGFDVLGVGSLTSGKITASISDASAHDFISTVASTGSPTNIIDIERHMASVAINDAARLRISGNIGVTGFNWAAVEGFSEVVGVGVRDGGMRLYTSKDNMLTVFLTADSDQIVTLHDDLAVLGDLTVTGQTQLNSFLDMQNNNIVNVSNIRMQDDGFIGSTTTDNVIQIEADGDVVIANNTLSASVIVALDNFNDGTMDLTDGDYTSTGTLKLTNATAGGLSIKTAATTPGTRGLLEALSSVGTPLDDAVTTTAIAAFAFFDTTGLGSGSYSAGSFNNNTTGEIDTSDAFYIGLSGNASTVLTHEGGGALGKAVTVRGLDFIAQNENDWINTHAFLASTLTVTGMELVGRLGSAGKEISGPVNTVVHGANASAQMLGEYSSSLDGNVYGMKVTTTDSLDDASTGDINAYGLHVTAAASDTHGGGGVLTSWGIFQASDVDNAINGRLRIGDTTPPTNELEVNGVSQQGDGGDTHYNQFAADGLRTMHGTARVTIEMRLPLAGTGGGAERPTFNDDFEPFDGWEMGINDELHYVFEVPSDTDTSEDIEFHIHWFIDEARTGANETINWQIFYRAVKEDGSEAIDAGGRTATITSGNTLIPTTAKGLLEISVGVIVAANIDQDDVIGLDLSRIAIIPNGVDDPTNDPIITAVEVHYTKNKDGEDSA